MKKPRDYQTAGATAVWDHIHSKPQENPLVLMPTGSGKSLTMAMLVSGIVQTYHHVNILNLVHVKELVEGNYNELMGLWPTAPAGVYSAGLGRREIRQITYAGIDSIKSALKLLPKIHFVFVDEAHRISDKDQSTYQKTFAALREVNPDLSVIGFTATGYRAGMGMLTDGKLFDEVCFDLSSGPAFVWMLEQKYLLRLVPKNPGVQVDESKVKVRAGEYDETSASAAFRDQDILEQAIDRIIEYGEDRQAWLIFAQSIEDCELIADMLRYKGYPVEAVHSKRGDRDAVIASFRRGELRGIVNQNILTTGFDDPRIDLIAMLRLTRSPGLWVQMLGRGTRPLWVGHIGHNGGPPLYDISTLEGRTASILASPKQNCLVLDFAGNTTRLGPINYPNIPAKKGSKKGKPPVRECPECGTYNHISIKACEECGYVFPVEQKLSAEAGRDELVLDLNSLPPPAPREFGVFKVDQMVAAVQKAKPGKWPTMRVDYFAGVRRFSTWVCPEHPGFPSRKANEWWLAHGGDIPPPETAQAMVDKFNDLTKPHYIRVWVNTKYPEIDAYDFVGNAFQLPPELGGPQGPPADPEDEAAEAERARIDALFEGMDDDDIPF